MPTVNGPDGASFSFPDGTPPEQMQAALAQHYGNGAPAQPQPGGLLDQLSAGVRAASHQVPFVGDAAMTAGAMASDVLHGHPQSWQDANGQVHQLLADDAHKYPVTTALSGVAGGVGSAVVGGAALKAGAELPVIGDGLAAIARAGQLRKGELLANTARMAAAGAAQGGAQAGGEQLAADPGNPAAAVAPAAGGAALGGIAGAVGGNVVAGAANAGRALISRLSGSAASAMAKVFGETPGDLQALWSQHVQETGRPPSMAEMATYKQLGVINDFKNSSTTIADALNQRQAQVAAERSANMQAGFTLGPEGQRISASPTELGNIRTQQGDLDYPQARSAPDFKVSTEESPDYGGASPADHLASTVVPQAGLPTPDKVRIMQGLQDGKLSAEDAQMLRSRLSAAGQRGQHSPALETAQSDLAAILGAPENAPSAAPLDRATARSAANANVVNGAEHGATITGAATPGDFAANAQVKANANPNFAQGMALGANDKLAAASATPQGATALAARLATDSGLHDKLTTTFGADTADALQRMGAAETRSAQALSSVTGGAPKTDDSGMGDIAQVGMALASHGWGWKLIHAVKAGVGLEMPQAVQDKVAQYLTDPKMVRQGLNLLAKAGATSQQLRRASLTAAAAAGIGGGDVAGPQDHGGVTVESVTPATPEELAQPEQR